MSPLKKKICLLGAFAVGKTSLVGRFVLSLFSERYQTTVGVKVDKKELALASGPLTLVIWDVHGEDHVQSVRAAYLRGAAGYLLVADGTRAYTLDVAEEIRRRVEAELGPRPFVLLLNKSDRRGEWEITPGRVEALREQGWTVIETSARDGIGVEDGFRALGEKLVGEHPPGEG